MIVCGIGYGYLTRFIFQRICRLGIIGFGITSRKKDIKNLDNVILYDRLEIKSAILFSTHLLITVPPTQEGCNILKDFSKVILSSNIKTIIYISTTGVYGNHRGNWVNEQAELKAKFTYDNERVKAEKQWKSFSNKNKINLNIVRISGFYGPGRIKPLSKKEATVIVKKGHYFSRIHILDAARIISKIILESQVNEIWNLADNNPTSREDFILEIFKIKKIKKYNSILYQEYSKKITKRYKKFWVNNKRVSNEKVKSFFEYKFIFPSYKSGLKNLKEYL